MEVVDVLLGDLDIRLQLQDVNEVLTLVGQLLLEVVNLLHGTWVLQLIEHVEEHGVLIRLLHDLGHLVVEVIQQRSSWMVDDVQE